MDCSSAFRAPVVVSYGGGTNSTALLIELVERRLPVDLILFADTGGERPSTYRYVELFSRWLTAQGYPKIQMIHRVNRLGFRSTLESECLEKGILPSLAYGYKKCSLKFKVQPQEKFVNHWPPAIDAWARGLRITKIIGFDADEERRVRYPDDPKYEYHYPLIQWGWGREECIAAIRRAHLSLPGKSACFFCPATKKSEILELAQAHPDLLGRALQIERKAKPGLHSIAGLGRSFSWESFLSGNPLDSRVPHPEEPCGCYDG